MPTKEDYDGAVIGNPGLGVRAKQGSDEQLQKGRDGGAHVSEGRRGAIQVSTCHLSGGQVSERVSPGGKYYITLRNGHLSVDSGPCTTRYF